VNSEIKDEDVEVGIIHLIDYESGEELGIIRLQFSLDILRGDVGENLSRLWAGSTYNQVLYDLVIDIIAKCEHRNPEFMIWKELMTDDDSALLVSRFNQLDPSNIVHRTFARMTMEGPGTDDVGKLDVWLKATREEECRSAALQFREPADIHNAAKKKIPDLPRKYGDAYKWVLVWSELEPKLKLDPSLKIDMEELKQYLQKKNFQLKEDTIKKIIACGTAGNIPSIDEFERRE